MIDLNFKAKITRMSGNIAGRNTKKELVFQEPETMEFVHLIDENVSILLAEVLMAERSDMIDIATQLYSSGTFEATNEQIQEIKNLVASRNEYRGLQIDGLFKAQILSKLI